MSAWWLLLVLAPWLVVTVVLRWVEYRREKKRRDKEG